jgi:hypothetical protein
VRKPEGKRKLGRSKSRLYDNNKVDLQEVGWWGTDWVDMA